MTHLTFNEACQKMYIFVAEKDYIIKNINTINNIKSFFFLGQILISHCSIFSFRNLRSKI